MVVVKVGLQKILNSIDQLRTRVDGKDQDLQFLSDILASSQLQSLVKVCNLCQFIELNNLLTLDDKLCTYNPMKLMSV